MDAIDAAYQKLSELLAAVRDYGDTIFTEEDTRIKVIDRMSVDVLGWPLQTHLVIALHLVGVVNKPHSTGTSGDCV